MSHVIILAGLPGSGKTHYRNQEFPDLPGVDVSEVYADHYKRFPEIPLDWRLAHAVLHRKVAKLMRKHDTIWVEAMFAKGSPSLSQMISCIKFQGGTYEIRRSATPIQECLERVKADYEAGRENAIRTAARVRILRNAFGNS